MPFPGRVGQFFFFIGFLALVIFYASDQAHSPIYTLLCSGVLLFPLGLYMMWRYRNPPPESDRFNTLRRMRQRRLGKQQDNKKNKPQRQ